MIKLLCLPVIVTAGILLSKNDQVICSSNLDGYSYMKPIHAQRDR